MAKSNSISNIGHLGTIQNKAKAIKTEIQQSLESHAEQLKFINIKYETTVKEVRGKKDEEEITQQAADERDKSLEKENNNFQKSQESLNSSLQNILSQIIDPFAAQKLQKIQANLSIKTTEKDNKANAAAAKKEMIKKISKTLPPIVGYLIGKLIIALIVNNKKLERLVNQTNAYITLANKSNNAAFLNSARLKRADAVRTLNESEKKLIQVKKIIDTIHTILTILLIIISILESLPQIPPPVKAKIEKYKLIIELINLILAIVSPVIQKEINYLERLKAKLKQVGDILDNFNNLTKEQISTLLANVGKATELGQYKGFKFAIREDNSPNAITIAGNKRKYAVAIDTNNVDVLRSELSFTLDPNDLIDQLKLVIDQQNLIA